MTVIPAHGRDYKTATQAKLSWAANQDWIVADYFNKWDGKPINRTSLIGGRETVTLRFNNLTKTCTVQS